MTLSITAQSESLSQVWNTALFGGLFPDNYVTFRKKDVVIADLSMNALLVYAEFSPKFFLDYSMDSDSINFGITAELEKIHRKAFSHDEELSFVVEGIDVTLKSKLRTLTDKVKKASSPHVTLDKFVTKVVDSPYGFITEPIQKRLAEFNKIQINSDLMNSLTQTTANDLILNIKENSFSVNQDNQDSTWNLQETLDGKIEFTAPMSIRVSKQNFNTALSVHNGVVWVLCHPTIISISSSGPNHNMLTFVSTKKLTEPKSTKKETPTGETPK